MSPERSFATALLALLFPVQILAQSATVAGRVLVAGTSQPISGASVVVVGTQRGVVADSAGRYALTDLPVGRYELEARHIGKRPERVSIIVRTGETATLNFRLVDAPAELVGIEVIGARSDALERLPGSAMVISQAEIAAQQPLSANEVLRVVPGVHLQEEEGVGLRANIGIRGLDPDRSRTVLILEDGVPVALAPYGEPEMYYTPPIDRMERVEIIKGSGSILFGPQTIGGVVNFVTADAPSTPEGRLWIQGGSGSSLFAKARFGGTWGNTRGNAGLLRKQANDLNGLSFDLTDFTGKLGFRTGSGDFGLKLSAYDEISNSTYIGLTDSLFRASPFIHPAPDDRLRLRRYALTGTHQIALGVNTTLRTNVYGYQTTRNWQRQDYTYTESGSNYVFSNTTGNRNREFEVVGVEPRLRTSWSLLGLHSDLDLGARAHYERARDQHINGSTATSRTGEIRDDEIRTGRALAGFIQNRIFLSSSLHITPGLRLESFNFDRHILRMRVRRQLDSTTTREPEDVDITTSDDIIEVIPGVGTAWTPNAVITVFAGAHRGFSPPRVKDALIYEDPTLAPDQQVPALTSLELDAERSWNYEFGARVTPASYLGLAATAFYLDFSNQIIEPSLSAGSVAQAALANQGETRHAGVEAEFSLDIGKLLRRPYSLTANVGYTFVDAVFSAKRLLETAEGDTVNIEGNQLPYAPRHKANAALTFTHASGLTLRLDGTFVGEQFSDNFETVPGSANGRIGRIPAYEIFDLTARYHLDNFDNLSLVCSIKNLTGETYIASRRPEGIKPGLPRLATVGVIWDF